MGSNNIYQTYNGYNEIKSQISTEINNNYTDINNKLDKNISYRTIEKEYESLLKREQNLFIINNILTIGLFIIIFKVL